MTKTVWDSLGDGSGNETTAQGASMGIGGYHHLVSLFQAMPYDVSDKDRKHISESLQKAITSGSFGMVNSTFTSQLDAGLSDPKVRQHLLEAVKNDPKAVDQKMGELINHPDRTAALIMALPTGANVPAPVQVAQNAPAAVAAAPSIKHHYNHHSSAAPVVNAPVNDASDDDTPTVEASNAKPTTGTAKPPAQVAAQVEDNNSFHPPGAASANGGFDLGGMIGKLFSSDAGAGMKSFLTDNTFGKMLGGLLAMFIPGLDKMLSGGQSTDAKGQPAMSVASKDNGSLYGEALARQSATGTVKNETTGQTVSLGGQTPAASTAAPLPANSPFATLSRTPAMAS